MAVADNPSRERILERVRKALGSQRDGGAAGFPEAKVADAPLMGTIFSPIADAFQRFAAECKSNLTELVLTEGREASAAALQNLLQALPEGEVFVQDSPALREMLCDMPVALGVATARVADQAEASVPGGIAVPDAGLISAPSAVRTLRWSSEGPPREASQACITLAEALVAQTGSIMTSAAMGGRGASIVPPCHIVFATRNQIVPDIDAALAQAERLGLTRNSYLGLITGSSRTADIEKILVLGAHGPMRVVVVLEGK
jgi:L-lactate utilization protein LutC